MRINVKLTNGELLSSDALDASAIGEVRSALEYGRSFDIHCRGIKRTVMVRSVVYVTYLREGDSRHADG